MGDLVHLHETEVPCDYLEGRGREGSAWAVDLNVAEVLNM